VICKPCAEGADHCAKFKNVPVAQAYHALCPGPAACDCQHKAELQAAGKSVQR
jgi:hypothetical protein